MARGALLHELRWRVSLLIVCALVAGASLVLLPRPAYGLPALDQVLATYHAGNEQLVVGTGTLHLSRTTQVYGGLSLVAGGSDVRGAVHDAALYQFPAPGRCTASGDSTLVPGAMALVATCSSGTASTIVVVAFPAHTALQPAPSAPPIQLALSCGPSTALASGGSLLLASDARRSGAGASGSRLSLYRWSSSTSYGGLLLAGPRGAVFNYPASCRPLTPVLYVPSRPTRF